MRGDCRDRGLGGRREAGRGRARGRSGGGAGSVEPAGGAPTLWGGPWQAPDDKGASQEGTGILAAWTGRFSVVCVLRGDSRTFLPAGGRKLPPWVPGCGVDVDWPQGGSSAVMLRAVGERQRRGQEARGEGRAEAWDPDRRGPGRSPEGQGRGGSPGRRGVQEDRAAESLNAQGAPDG